MLPFMNQDLDLFPTVLESILSRVDQVDPVKYASTRNFIDGAVTRLSPYISRGVISTRMVLESVLNRGYDPKRIQKFIQELAWREYYQRTWQVKLDKISDDLRWPQAKMTNREMPESVVTASTGITAVDEAISGLYETGYIHNHVRMYIASIACNVGQRHWLVPARWMYYHLIDGDWASNALSWQWVAGTSSSKKYYANQENINRYCHTAQGGTFLDADYEDLEFIEIPDELLTNASPNLETILPKTRGLTIERSLPTLIYNSYNLDPWWNVNLMANRILLLEPSHFRDYPVSNKVVQFILGLSQNIDNVQIYRGEFSDLVAQYGLVDYRYKEHPLNNHYIGTEEPRDWMFDVAGYYPSFFSFWKKCDRQLAKNYAD